MRLCLEHCRPKKLARSTIRSFYVSIFLMSLELLVEVCRSELLPEMATDVPNENGSEGRRVS